MYTFNKEDIFLVTGASSGIGRATALLLNSCGASVIANGRNENALKELKAECDNKDNLYIEAKDLLEDIESLPLWIKSLKDKYGKLKGLICSAGIHARYSLQMIDYKIMKNVADIHYFVPLMLSKGFSDRRVNTGNNCSIIYLSSISSFMGYKSLSLYGGVKGALISTAKSLANELKNKGIRVNTISPGFVNTPMLLEDRTQSEINDIINNNVIIEPVDIAKVILFLCSENSLTITGQNIVTDGGGFCPSRIYILLAVSLIHLTMDRKYDKVYS